MGRVDLVSQVANQFEEEILAGKLKAGDLLPPEREISANLKVSRSVVREAIGRLISMGLVVSIHGSGNRVQPPSHQPILMGYRRALSRGSVHLEDVAAVRLPLETAIARLAAIHHDPSHLERLESTQAILGSVESSLDAGIQADLAFHSILAEATGNPLFQCVLDPIQELLITTRRLTLSRFGTSLAHTHHQKILDAVRKGDPDEAEREMRAHLQTNYSHLQSQTATLDEPPPTGQTT